MLENQFNFKESGKILQWVTEMPTKNLEGTGENRLTEAFGHFEFCSLLEHCTG